MDLKIYVCPDCEAVFDSSEYVDGKCPDCGGIRVMTEEDYYRSIENRPFSTPTTPNVPKCPICGSTNLSKITIAHKAGKIALFGIFGMGDNGKTWKCNNCGSKF